MPHPIGTCTIGECDGERVTPRNKLCAMHNWRKKRYGDPLYKREGTRGPNVPREKHLAIQAWVKAILDLGDARALAARLELDVHTVEVAANRYRHRIKKL